MFDLVLKSLIVGVLVGGSIAAGAVRMFKAPEVMGEATEKVHTFQFG